MNPLKQLVKSIAVSRSQQDVVPLDKLMYLGSANHGTTCRPTTSPVRRCATAWGPAGTDISLDTELAARFGAQVFIFDPMPYALDHFNALVSHTKAGQRFTADNDAQGYVYTISNEALATIMFGAIGVWDEKKTIKFYVPSRENYAGHSITNLQNTADYLEAPVDKLVNIMRELGHAHIDLLKLEIEGSEYTVIDNVLAENLDVKIMLIEYDEFHHRKGLARLAAIRHIEHSTHKLLQAGYKLVHSLSFYKRTFIRNDVFELLDK